MAVPVYSRRYVTGALAVSAIALISGCTSSGSSTSAASGLARPSRPNQYKYTGEVYLLRGLANVFSTGLDVMNDKFKARGVNSRVDNHAVWQAWADDIIARNRNGQVSYPIIIMGHSLGGNACVQMARYLGDAGVPVSFVAAFDPTITTEPGPNVAEVVNYYLPNGKAGMQSNVVVPISSFTGQVSNEDVSGWDGMTHFNVEKNDILQVRVMTKTMNLLKPRFTGVNPENNR